jgi:hypothetical protein
MQVGMMLRIVRFGILIGWVATEGTSRHKKKASEKEIREKPRSEDSNLRALRALCGRVSHGDRSINQSRISPEVAESVENGPSEMT